MEQAQQIVDKNSKVKFFLTGFGPFGSVIDNPTSLLIFSLTQEEKQQNGILDAQVLEVSTVAVKEYYSQKKEYFEKLEQDNETIYINIHMGVNDSGKNINLEQFGYNMADFCIPDVRNLTCKKQKIFEQYELDEPVKCKLPLETYNKNLQNIHKVDISDDPGRYICNYVYFNSLEFYKEKCKTASLFVHFPQFTIVDQQAQKKFLLSLLSEIKKNNQL